MSDDGEYELNVLIEKLTKVLTEHQCLLKTRSVHKAFNHIIKKVKNLEYINFDSYLTDVKIVFSILKRKDQMPPNLEEAEQEFAEILNTLIKMDYYKSDNESDTSASDSVNIKSFKAKEKSPKSSTKKKKLKTPQKSKLSPGKQEKIKIKLKLTPNKVDPSEMTDFDFDVNSTKVQSLCSSLLKVAGCRSQVQKAFNNLPDNSLFPDYYDIIQLPISLTVIKESISMGLYTSLYHCYSDIQIMVLNAKTYNEPKTDIYNMALETLAAITRHMSNAKVGDKSLRTSVSQQLDLVDYRPVNKKFKCNENLYVDYWNMFSQVLSKCNKNGRPLATAFLVLPNKDQIPLYYKSIKKPQSLCGIRSKIIKCQYQHVPDLISDMNLMCDNAIKFNTKSSIISKDAVSLKDYVNHLADLYMKNDNEVVTDIRPVKVGEKRKAVAISRSRSASKEVASPAVKKERSENPPAPPPPPAKVVECEVKQEESSVEYLVFTCFTELKDKGPEIQSEMIRLCSVFHNNVDNIVDVEDILETTEDCRNVLLKIVCAMSSRIDSMCPEFQTIESVLVKLVNMDKDFRKILDSLPVYCHQGEDHYLQEELMALLRHTDYGPMFSQNREVSRVTKPKSELISSIAALDILSDDVILVKCDEVTQCLETSSKDLVKTASPRLERTPILEKLKKPITPKVEPKTPKAVNTPRSGPGRPPKSATSTKTPRSKAAKTPVIHTDTPVRSPKPITKLKKEDASMSFTPEQPNPYSLSPGLVAHQFDKAMKLLKSIKNMKSSTDEYIFEDFFEIPTSKSYHGIIKYPMSLNTIEKSLKNEMNSASDVISNILLIVKNARYYNEDKSGLYDSALLLQKSLLSKISPKDTTEVSVLAAKQMIELANDLKENTEIEELTKSDGNTKFMNMTFSQFYSDVQCGYYTRMDKLQDDLIHIIVSNMNSNQFTETGTKLLSVLQYYLIMRDRMITISSKCFRLTMEKFTVHFKDRIDIDIPHAPISCLTYHNNSYIVGDKVKIRFSEDDVCILHVNQINSPCWLAGTVYFETTGDTLFKTDIKDIVHVKYVEGKVTKRYRYYSYNYRTKSSADISTNRSEFCKDKFDSFFSNLSLSRFDTQSIVHGTSDHKTYYLQYLRDNGDLFKLGDFVYLKSDSDLPYIARIDKIHKDRKGNVYVFGPWFIRPMDTRVYGTKAFFSNEVLMSNITDRNHINSVEGKCDILSSRDYMAKHPLEFLNKDVYICDNKYDESTHKFSKLTESKLYYCESAGSLEKKEWMRYETPRRMFKQLRPPFLKPVSVEDLYSSDEGDGGKDSDMDFTPDTSRFEARTPKPMVPKHTPIYNPYGQATPAVIRATPGSQNKQTLEHRIAVNNTIVMNNSLHLGYNAPSSNISTSHVTTTKQQAPNRLQCRWVSCSESSTDPNEFYQHVINIQTHLCGTDNPNWKCSWVSCTDKEAKTEGLGSQILLRRHLLTHMTEAGYKPPAPAKRPPVLRHSEAYRGFLRRLALQKQNDQINAAV